MRKGQKMSQESRQKLSATLKLKGIRPPSRLGIPNTESQKDKIRTTQKAKGHKPPISLGENNPSKRPEVRAKIAESKRGKKLSEEHKLSLSINHRKKNSLETRIRMSISHLDRVKNGTHHNYKGGTTSEAIRIRGSIEYVLWRESVFRRDNYTCQICESRGGILHAHHIKSFVNYPELRFNLSNGITFCKKCHKEFHSTYGY